MTNIQMNYTVPHLEHSCVLLRPFHMHDASVIFAYASHEMVTQFTHWEKHTSITDTQSWIHKTRNTPTWAIIDKSSGALIGECGLINQEKTEAEIHCALAPSHWGKGFAHNALSTLLDFSFCELSITTIRSSIIAENSRSIRLAEKLGMQHDATIPHAWYANNTLHDVLIYSLAKK